MGLIIKSLMKTMEYEQIAKALNKEQAWRYGVIDAYDSLYLKIERIQRRLDRLEGKAKPYDKGMPYIMQLIFAMDGRFGE